MPDARELRFDLVYETPVGGDWGNLALGLVHRIDANHIAGEHETLGLLRLQRTF